MRFQIQRGKRPSKRVFVTRWASYTLVAALCSSFLMTNCAAAEVSASDGVIKPSCDEAYYATLDYYGAIQEGSVVKSYRMNGASELTDYGRYDEVVNLTDGSQPIIEDDKLVFQPDQSRDSDRFYFEGKTTQPFSELPWTLNVSYQLNGVKKEAEDLGGATGLIEIDIDALPNSGASEYCRNNFVLQAAAVFNADDILSLDAPGAQIQMIGNLQMVLFLAMPGEEQHFAIRVGSDDFTFSGLTFLIVPATLSQLDQIADLRDAKEKTEDSFDEINDSMDAILDSLDGIDNSLNATADGLDDLNDARATISAGKGGVYDSADGVISDLSALYDALDPLNGHLTTAGQALTDITAVLTKLNENAGALKEQLEETRGVITKIQTDSNALQELIDDMEDNEPELQIEVSNLMGDFSDLGDNLEDLQSSLKSMRTVLSHLSGLSEVDEIGYNGMSIAEVEALVDTLNTQHAAYVSSGYGGTFEDYLSYVLLQQAYAEYMSANPDSTVTYDQFVAANPDGVTAAATKANSLNTLWEYAQTAEYDTQIEQADTINTLIDSVNGTVTEVNTMISALKSPTSSLLEDLEELNDTLGADGMSGDLQDVLDMLYDILDTLQDHQGDLTGLLSDLDAAGDIAAAVSENADTAIDLLDQLDDTVNQYVPDTQQALTDLKSLNTSAQSGIKNLQTFLQTLEDLLKSSGSTLDAGTEQTLNGLADTMRRSASGLGNTNQIRDAKNDIKDLLTDEWDTYTGEESNLLNMDAGALPVSLTSSLNAAPTSIQVLMRTQEIEEPEEETGEEETEAAAANSTFLGRVGAMFQDFWHAVTGLFHRG